MNSVSFPVRWGGGRLRALGVGGILAGGVLLLPLSPVRAQPYTAYSHALISTGHQDSTNPAALPIGADSNLTNGHETAQASSYAGPGYLRSIADTFAHPDPLGSGAEAGSSASFTLTDLTFVGPAGQTLSSTVLHLQFDGTIDLFTDADWHTASSDGEADVSLVWNNNSFAGGSVAHSTTGSPTRTGLLAGYDPFQAVNIDVPLLLAGAGPQTLTLSLATSSHARSIQPSSASSMVHFGNTLKFTLDGPVFDLPAGWTVNSAQGNITDNRFALAAAPEPGALPLLLVGATGGGVALHRRPRRQ